ncbi:hypothetical protein V2J09_023006 [Rumex salicifolius]
MKYYALGIPSLGVSQLKARTFVGSGFSAAKVEEDLITILERAPWTIRNKPLVLRRWKEGMPLDLSCLDNIPIWVTIPELDVRFWSEHMLERIGSAIGIPILTHYHSATQGRLSFARVLVEIAPDSVLLNEITFKGPKGELIS